MLIRLSNLCHCVMLRFTNMTQLFNCINTLFYNWLIVTHLINMFCQQNQTQLMQLLFSFKIIIIIWLMRPKPTMEGESFESYNNSGRDGNMTIETRNILYIKFLIFSLLILLLQTTHIL